MPFVSLNEAFYFYPTTTSHAFYSNTIYFWYVPAMSVLVYALHISVSKTFIRLLQIISICLLLLSISVLYPFGKFVERSFQPICLSPAPSFVIGQAKPGPRASSSCEPNHSLRLCGVQVGLGVQGHTCVHVHMHTPTPKICLLNPSANNKSCHGDTPKQKFWGYQFHNQPRFNQAVCLAGNII